MKNFCFAVCMAMVFYANHSYGSEAGMPQLDPEFWTAQIFWLILIFSILYIINWKIFLPKITDSIENRKSRIIHDISETEKLKKTAEKKLDEYNKIIEDSKNEAKKVINENKKKLEKDIENKKQKFDEEIEEELKRTEEEIKNLKKTSVSSINKIAVEIASETIKQIIGTEVNKSNVTAIVDDLSKKKMEKFL